MFIYPGHETGSSHFLSLFCEPLMGVPRTVVAMRFRLASSLIHRPRARTAHLSGAAEGGQRPHTPRGDGDNDSKLQITHPLPSTVAIPSTCRFVLSMLCVRSKPWPPYWPASFCLPPVVGRPGSTVLLNSNRPPTSELPQTLVGPPEDKQDNRRRWGYVEGALLTVLGWERGGREESSFTVVRLPWSSTGQIPDHKPRNFTSA